MKTFTIATFIGILFIVLSTTKMYSQPTTQEEYNYVTKGYKVLRESGLDMKQGYAMISIDTVSTSIASAELLGFYRIKDNKKEIAAYCIIYKRTNRATEFICVPNPKSEKEIRQSYYTALWDGYSEASSKGQLISILLSQHINW